MLLLSVYVDIDECSDTNACSGPSMCVNSDGSFQCVCNMGYMIQGTECIGELTWSEVHMLGVLG